MASNNNKCKECGCVCNKCITDHDVHLHVEIEHLKQRLAEKDNHIVTMETNFLNEANKFPNGEFVALREELVMWQDKYKRLHEAHRRVQRVNQGLEDKLLKLVDVCETEKTTLTKDVASLSHKLADANYTIKKLTDDNERYKSDVALAIQFLQCKQSNFVSQKIDSLPPEVQSQVSSYLTNKRKPEERKIVPEVKSIKVPIPTFPPTAMVYSVPKSPSSSRKVEEDEENPPVDIVSAAIMAKVLEERERERSLVKHCDTCTCSSKKIKIVNHEAHHHVGVQTVGLCFCNLKSTLDSLERPCSTKMQNTEKENGKTKVLFENKDNYAHNEHKFIQKDNAEIQTNNVLNNDSNISSLINLSSASTSNLNLLDLSPMHTSFKPDFDNKTTKQARENVKHHHLCDKVSPSYEVDVEKCETEINIDHTSAKDLNGSSEHLKGPRYCSMRVQSGSKNILLDNAHNNVAPVLYTRQSGKAKREINAVRAHDNLYSNSCSSGEYKAVSVSSENSAQNQQRIADWVQNSNDFEASSPDNSKSEPVKKNADLIKYAEMEDNVKKFLFGESEFLKTVEIGKLKYQNLRESEKPVINSIHNGKTSRSNSHTETEI